MIVLIIICSIISSILYRAGGLSKEQPYWIPVWMRHSWVRDWLCPLFCLVPMGISFPPWMFLLSYGAMAGAFSHYSSYKGENNFWVSGLLVGLAAAPLAFSGFPWWLLLARALFIAVTWGAWSRLIGNDHWEEHGRGFLVGISSVLVYL